MYLVNKYSNSLEEQDVGYMIQWLWFLWKGKKRCTPTLSNDRGLFLDWERICELIYFPNWTQVHSFPGTLQQWNPVFWLLVEAEAAWFWCNVRGSAPCTGPGVVTVKTGEGPPPQVKYTSEWYAGGAPEGYPQPWARTGTFLISPPDPILGNLDGTCICLAVLPKWFKALPKIF